MSSNLPDIHLESTPADTVKAFLKMKEHGFSGFLYWRANFKSPENEL